ncbi:MAG: NAD(P)(+) transhydrogenase (Re/Si-specific) subunit beta [Candidatus Kapaibacterium sp.]
MDSINVLYVLYVCYLIASVLFVVGLKMLSHPDSARKGNLLAAFGMGLAILGTIVLHHNKEGQPITNHVWILVAMAIGSVIGWLSAKKVAMTAMPQMVSIFNGMGGACAAVISLIEFGHYSEHAANGISIGTYLTIIAGLIIGSVSFSGSVIAFLKLQGIMNKNFRLPAQNIFNGVMMLATLGLGTYLVTSGLVSMPLVLTVFALSLIYGVMFVVPIGGADMPVVISLLNSFTGVAAAFGGFLYDNQAMLTGGILVGSAGTLLTIVMCNAMNRSLTNVLFSAFGDSGSGGGASGPQGSVREMSATDVAVMMNYSSSVVIVPGYGLAVAQGQHIVQKMASVLEERGVDVKYAIHPVAGRMPGHMNVLLAESNVPYEQLKDMEEINPEFPNVDVVLVIGANDVVNPAARYDTNSPIYGMPILDADKAKNVIVMKRGMNAGYAGIENELFFYPNCYMLFGDAKKSLEKLVEELQAL